MWGVVGRGGRQFTSNFSSFSKPVLCHCSSYTLTCTQSNTRKLPSGYRTWFHVYTKQTTLFKTEAEIHSNKILPCNLQLKRMVLFLSRQIYENVIVYVAFTQKKGPGLFKQGASIELCASFSGCLPAQWVCFRRRGGLNC